MQCNPAEGLGHTPRGPAAGASGSPPAPPDREGGGGLHWRAQRHKELCRGAGKLPPPPGGGVRWVLNKCGESLTEPEKVHFTNVSSSGIVAPPPHPLQEELARGLDMERKGGVLCPPRVETCHPTTPLSPANDWSAPDPGSLPVLPGHRNIGWAAPGGRWWEAHPQVGQHRLRGDAGGRGGWKIFIFTKICTSRMEKNESLRENYFKPFES